MENYYSFKEIHDKTHPGKKTVDIDSDIFYTVCTKRISFYRIDTRVDNVIWGTSFHRWNGPAVLFKNGNKTWFFNNHHVAHYRPGYGWRGKFYQWTVDNDIDIDNITDDDVTLIKLIWFKS